MAAAESKGSPASYGSGAPSRPDRRRNEVDLGKTRATQEAVAADARAAGNADRRQEQIGDLAEQRPHWPAPSCCAGA